MRDHTKPAIYLCSFSLRIFTQFLSPYTSLRVQWTTSKAVYTHSIKRKRDTCISYYVTSSTSQHVSMFFSLEFRSQWDLADFSLDTEPSVFVFITVTELIQLVKIDLHWRYISMHILKPPHCIKIKIKEWDVGEKVGLTYLRPSL